MQSWLVSSFYCCGNFCQVTKPSSTAPHSVTASRVSPPPRRRSRAGTTSCRWPRPRKAQRQRDLSFLLLLGSRALRQPVSQSGRQAGSAAYSLPSSLSPSVSVSRTHAVAAVTVPPSSSLHAPWCASARGQVGTGKAKGPRRLPLSATLRPASKYYPPG